MEVVGVTMADMAEITPEEAGVTTLAVAEDGAKTTEMITVVWAAWVDLTHGVHKEEETILVGEKILVGSITLRVVTAEITLEAGVTTPAAADGATIPAETEMEAGTMAATEVAMEATKGVDPWKQGPSNSCSKAALVERVPVRDSPAPITNIAV